MMKTKDDVVSSARMFLERYGSEAPREAAMRAHELRNAGDPEAAALWLEVEKAAKDLLEAQNPGHPDEY